MSPTDRGGVGRTDQGSSGRLSGSPPPSAPDGAAGSVRPTAAPDLRLAGFAVAVWLSALTALHLSATAALGSAVGAAGMTLGLVGVRRRVRLLSNAPTVLSRGARLLDRHGWTIAALLFGVLCGAGATGARLAVRDADVLRTLVAQHAVVQAGLVVVDDPRPLSRAAGRPTTHLVSAELTWLRTEDGTRTTMSVRILVLGTDPRWRGLLPGQHLTVTGRLTPPRGGDLTAAVLSVGTAPQLSGRPSWIQRAAGDLRSGLQRACTSLPDEPGGLLPGLVVGDTSRLPPAVEADFQATGMTHLNAVSGSNVAVVIGLVLLLARWARAGPVLAGALSAVALVGFVVLARPSPSVVRAAVMGAIGLVALAAGRPRAALPALCAAVAVLVLLDPELSGDPGFALSVLATGGLLLLAPGWRDALRRRGVPAGLAEALAVPAAAQLACGPVVAGLSGAVSLVAVPANLLAVPAVAPATVLGVVAAVLSPLWPGGAAFVAWLGSWPAWWLVLVARYGAQLPAGTLPWIGGVAGGLLLGVLTVVLLMAARRPGARRLVGVVALAAVVGALPVRLVAAGWPPAGLLVAACAVGQGDAIVLPDASGRAVVVDAGPDPTLVDGCLDRLGVHEVSLLVVSHFHADHVGGVEGVFRGRRVRAVLVPPWAEPASGRALVEAAARPARVPLVTGTVGWRHQVGRVGLEVLGPREVLRGTRSDPNNNSLVVRARIGQVVVLLAGDAEREQQRDLLDASTGSDLRADVLKVSHHGSAYQEERFLDAVRPRVALVSVGLDNDYGHPSLPLLARLSRSGARVLRTDLQGDLAVLAVSNGLAVAVRGPDSAKGRR